MRKWLIPFTQSYFLNVTCHLIELTYHKMLLKLELCTYIRVFTKLCNLMLRVVKLLFKVYNEQIVN